MEFIFLTAAGQTLFTRSDLESGHWTQEEMKVTADFPYDPEKVIQRGQRIAFRDPATDNLEVFEIRSCVLGEPDHYQQLTAEHIAISELQDEHIDNAEITDKTASQALTTALTGTGWSVGNNTASGTSSGDFSRGSVWQAIGVIKTNWNVYITPRVVISSAGVITGKYLDISPAGGTWRGVRLSVSKNLPDVTVTYNDEEVVTALYGYGAAKNDKDLTFKDEVWTATSSHPAKPAGQTYLEWPAKTALYGRDGRPRFGYYQNANISSASVLLQKTWEALQAASEPKISIEGTCEDLYRLGYADEPLRLHDLALVEIEETGEVFYKEIIQLDVDLIDPTGNRLNIGDYIPNIIYINRQTSHHAGGGGGANNYSPEEQFNTYYQWENMTNEFGSMVGMVVGFRDGDYYIKAGEIALSINATTGESTALINADHVNISATSTVHTLAGSLEYDADGKLIIKDAGGVYVERTEQGVTAQFGVWDDGNLTGGVIVDKVNGSVNTYITGDHVNISATSTVHTLAGAMHVDNSGKLIIDSAGGMYVERTEQGVTSQFGVWDNGNLTGLTIAQLVNGETNATLNADHINISGTSTVQTLAGAMHKDANGKLILDNAGGVYVERTNQGVTAQFGVWDAGNLTGLTIASLVNGETNATLNASHINISADSTLRTLAGAMHVDSNGKLVLDQAGGVYVERTNQGVTSQFGVWDRGNLTGGVMVSQINGQTTTKLSGDVIDISSLALSINASSITIDADRIDVNGIITDLATENLTCLDFTCGALTAGDDLEAKADVYVDGTITCNDITSGGDISCTGLSASGTVSAGTVRCSGRTYTNSLTVNGDAVTWQSKTVVTSVTLPTITLAQPYTFTDINGTNRTVQGVSSKTDGSKSTTTINYLGS